MTDFDPSNYPFSAICEYDGCGSSFMASDQESFDAYTAPNGFAAVRPTVDGPWACEEHASEVGGGWLTS